MDFLVTATLGPCRHGKWYTSQIGSRLCSSSSRLLWNMIGLFPLTGQTTFLIASPWFGMDIDLGNDKTLNITISGGDSETAIYVQSLRVNGFVLPSDHLILKGSRRVLARRTISSSIVSRLICSCCALQQGWLTLRSSLGRTGTRHGLLGMMYLRMEGPWNIFLGQVQMGGVLMATHRPAPRHDLVSRCCPVSCEKILRY